LETLLNLVWLAISAALLLICGSHIVRAENRSRGMAAIALICLICLLFPVISMTDDLNSGNPAFLDPTKAKKLLAAGPLIAIALPWLSLQAPANGHWMGLYRQTEHRLPQLQLLAFSMSRRPPPSNPSRPSPKKY
jgi:hypothetical protein